jgi:hypothetical protein
MEKFKFTFIPVLVLMLCSFVFAGCEIDEDGRIKVDERGLTRVIRDLFSDDIFLQVDLLGMPIYGGNTPPDITGKFLSSPSILLASNYKDSYAPGYKFKDMTITYYEQNNRNLTVKVQQIQGNDVGNGMRGHIVGKGKNFTVFVVLDVLDEHGCLHKTGYIHSGTMSDEGIRNLHRVIIMIDNGGNPHKNLIGNGKGRLIYDSDGLSERISPKK